MRMRAKIPAAVPSTENRDMCKRRIAVLARNAHAAIRRLLGAGNMCHANNCLPTRKSIQHKVCHAYWLSLPHPLLLSHDQIASPRTGSICNKLPCSSCNLVLSIYSPSHASLRILTDEGSLQGRAVVFLLQLLLLRRFPSACTGEAHPP